VLSCQSITVLHPKLLFPGALNDNYAALRWLHDNAEALGVNSARIDIGGGGERSVRDAKRRVSFA
jgi:hypothetical protein